MNVIRHCGARRAEIDSAQTIKNSEFASRSAQIPPSSHPITSKAMAGANYMGGKRCSSISVTKYGCWRDYGFTRNAIRARTKDVTSRLQKGHFGKQRLNLLAHGLIQNSTRVLEQGARITAIDFAHARRQHPMLESVQTLIPQPISSIDTESHNSTSSAEHPPSRPKLTKFLRAFEQFERVLHLYAC